MFLFLWCPRWDLNPHGLPYAPQTYASASSATRTFGVVLPLTSGAEGGIRTHTSFHSLRPERSASASSATSASTADIHLTSKLSLCQVRLLSSCVQLPIYLVDAKHTPNIVSRLWKRNVSDVGRLTTPNFLV